MTNIMTTTSNSLELSRLIPANRAEVFAAWTVQDRMNWYCPEDMILVSADADVRVGGTFHASMQGGDGVVHTCHGVYLEIVTDQRLVFTHQWEGEKSRSIETRVTVEFADQAGGTLVSLTQEGFEDLKQVKDHERGWASTLEHLEKEFDGATLEESSERGAS